MIAETDKFIEDKESYIQSY